MTEMHVRRGRGVLGRARSRGRRGGRGIARRRSCCYPLFCNVLTDIFAKIHACREWVRAGVSYSFAKRPFSAAKVPLATAMMIQGDADRGGVLGEDILDVMKNVLAAGIDLLGAVQEL